CLQSFDEIRTFVRMDDFDLTSNQKRALAMIRNYLERNGRAPSLREISEYLGLSSHSSAQDYVEALIRKGALERLPHHRGLRLAHRSRGSPPAARSCPKAISKRSTRSIHRCSVRARTSCCASSA